MNTNANILKTHYIGIFRKIVSWSGLIALFIMSTLIPMQASAYSQITARSTTLSTSKPGASGSGVVYTIAFKPATTETVGAVGFTMCDQPYEVNSTCAQTAGASGGILGTSAVFNSGASSADFSSGFAIGSSGNCGTGSDSKHVCIYDASGVAVTAGTAETVVFNTITNPSAANTTFYINIFITTVGGASTVYSAPVDFGATAVSTGTELNVTATVQEALTFCVGTTITLGCTGVSGSTVSLGTSSPCPIMGSSYSCTGTSLMDANTNASSGYAIYYDGSTFTSSLPYTIPAIGSTVASSTAGTEQFGLAGTAYSGSGTGVFYNSGSGGNTNYCFASGTGCPAATGNGGKYAYVTGGVGNTTNTEVALASGPTSDNLYTMTYLGNVSATTKPGIYNATVDYICTGQF
jgi:hypothetical protein